MGIIQDRIQNVDTLIEKVRNHPLGFRLVDDGSRYTVTYPPGDFATHGVRCSYGLVHSKSEALTRILNAMERHWMESYPHVNIYSKVH